VILHNASQRLPGGARKSSFSTILGTAQRLTLFPNGLRT